MKSTSFMDFTFRCTLISVYSTVNVKVVKKDADVAN